MDKKKALEKLTEVQVTLADVVSLTELTITEKARIGLVSANLNLIIAYWKREQAKKEAHLP